MYVCVTLFFPYTYLVTDLFLVYIWPCIVSRGGELGVLRVREHPLSAQGAPSHSQMHPLKTKERDHKAPFKTDI